MAVVNPWDVSAEEDISGNTGTLTPTGVTPGVYTNATITVGVDGRITQAESGTAPGGGPVALTNVFNPLTYGAAMDGATDDTSAIQACIAAAAAVRGTVVIQGKTIVSQGLTLNNVNLIGATRDSYLRYVPASGVTDPLLTISGADGPGPVIVRDLDLRGPGGSALGGNLGVVDGIVITGGPALIQTCQLNAFGRGIVQNNPTGHIYVENCDVSTCYAGAAVLMNSGDFFFSYSRFSNLFANLLVYDVGANVTIENSHWGFAPYGIFQDVLDPNASVGGFLSFLLARHVAFESCGHAAIYTKRAYEVATLFDPVVSDLLFDRCTVTFNDTYLLPGRTRDYAIATGGVYGDCQISTGASTPPPGALGTIYISNYDAGILSLRGRGYSASSVVSPQTPAAGKLVITTGF